MGKINFTKENEAELRNLIADSVLSKQTYAGSLGQEYNVSDLNNLSIASLRTLSQFIQNKVSKLSIADEWVENPNIKELEVLTTAKKLISLIIGWKLYQDELAENMREKARLSKQLDDLIQAQKTPGDLIAEIKQKIDELS